MTAPDSNNEARTAAREGRIEVATVAVPHAGRP
jgi:hypothetical protein